MLKRISILVIICLAAFTTSAQTEKYTAPVKWERYAVSDKSVSILFPKLPVLVETEDVCSEVQERQYAVYAEGIVYGLNITFQSGRKAPDNCSRFSRKLDDKMFENRIQVLAATLNTEKIEKSTRNNLEVIKVNNEESAYWLINDFNNKRWFEVWTTDKDETNLKIKNFVESIKIEKKSSGIEIGKGANRSLGDEAATTLKTPQETKIKNGEKSEIIRVKVFLKPKATYTEEARRAETAGTVRLKVVFLANGSVGNIIPVDTLPNGLTEQAIAAVSKIVFAPAKRNNVAVSSVVTMEYGFSIY